MIITKRFLFVDVRPHQSLRVALVQPQEQRGKLVAQRYRHNTPARSWVDCITTTVE